MTCFSPRQSTKNQKLALVILVFLIFKNNKQNQYYSHNQPPLSLQNFFLQLNSFINSSQGQYNQPQTLFLTITLMGTDESKPSTNTTQQATGVWYQYLAQVEDSQKSEIAPFYKSEISYLQKLFRQLDKTNAKSLQLSDMRQLPCLTSHPFKQRFITLFQQQLTKIKTKKISLQIFLHLLTPFHINTQLQQKAKFLFRAYDWDKDFKVTHGDLVMTFRMVLRDKILGGLVSEEMVKAITGEALVKFGVRGEIKLEQFLQLLPKDEIMEVMTFRFSKNFQ